MSRNPISLSRIAGSETSRLLAMPANAYTTAHYFSALADLLIDRILAIEQVSASGTGTFG
jgi:hypothetical protein